MSQIGLGGILLTLTGSPVFTITYSNDFVLPASVPGNIYGIYEGAETLIRAFEPVGAGLRSLFIGKSGNNTMGGGAGLGCKIEAFGDGALNHVTTGNALVGIGAMSLHNVTSGGHLVAIGDYTGTDLTTEVCCTFVGTNAGRYAAGGAGHNIGIGYNALMNCSAGGNIAIGSYVLKGNTGSAVFADNVAIGNSVLYTTEFAINFVAVGNAAFYSMPSNQHQGVALGYQAGYYETLGSKLFIDNAARASEADGRIKALIYGLFDAASANQRLRINGRLGITHLPNYANDAAAGAALISGELYTVTGSDPLQVAAKI